MSYDKIFKTDSKLSFDIHCLIMTVALSKTLEELKQAWLGWAVC